MAQPKNYGFGEEAALLQSSARKFFQEHLPTDRLHALVAADHDPERVTGADWPRALWPQMIELGWTSLAVPESVGGLGLPAVAVAALAEEAGRAALPGPLLVTLSATCVLSACGDDAAPALAQILAGGAATLAMTNSQGSWKPGDTDITYCDGQLSGTACYVQDLRKVDYLLVSAVGDQGLRLFWVDVGAGGVEVCPDAIVDLTRDQGRVVFDQATAVCVSTNALAVLGTSMPMIWTLWAADMVGAAEWQLQTTVAYAQSRKQFDHQLGFFQAVKHQLVDVMIHTDESKSLVYNAACAIDCEPAKALQFAHMAKASASETAAFASGRSVQCHGGIGFTWECFLHLYFKRQKHSQVMWGDAAWHRSQLADILIGKVA